MAAELKAKVTLNSTAFSRGLRKLKGIANSFGKNFGKPIAEATKKIVKYGAAAAAAAAAGMTALVKTTADFEAELYQMHKRTGVSTKTLSIFALAAKKAGLELMDVDDALKTIATSLYEAESGTTAYLQSFDALGLSVKNFQGLSLDQSMLKTMKALAGMADKTKQSAIAMQLFGDNGFKVLPMIQGLDAATTRAKHLGLIVDDKQAKSAQKFNNSITDLIGSIKGLGLQGLDFSGLISGINSMTESLVYFRKSAKFQELKAKFTETTNTFIAQSERMVKVWNKSGDDTKKTIGGVIAAFGLLVATSLIGLPQTIGAKIFGALWGGAAATPGKIKTSFKLIKKHFKGLYEFAKGSIDTIKILFSKLPVPEKLKVFGKTIRKIGTFIYVFINAVKGLLGVSTNLTERLRAVRIAFRLAFAGGFGREALDSASALIEKIKILRTILPKILRIFGSIFDVLLAIDAIAAAFALGKTLQKYYGFGSKILSVFKDIGVATVSLVKTMASLYELSKGFKPSLSSLQWIEAYLHEIKLKYDETHDQVKKSWDSIFDFSGTPSSGTRNDRLSYLYRQYSEVKGWIYSLVEHPAISAIRKISKELGNLWHGAKKKVKDAFKPITDVVADITRQLRRTKVEKFIKPLEDVNLGKSLKLKDLANSISSTIPKLPLPGEKESAAIGKVTSSVERLKNAMKRSTMSRGMFSDFQQKLLDWKNNPNRKKKDKPDFNKSPYSIASRNKMWREAMKKAKEADRKATEKLIKDQKARVYNEEEKRIKQLERQKLINQTQSHLTNNKSAYDAIKSNLVNLEARYNEERNKENFYKDQIKKINEARELDQKDKSKLQKVVKDYEGIQLSEKNKKTTKGQAYLKQNEEAYKEAKRYLDVYKKQDVETNKKLEYLKKRKKESSKKMGYIRAEYSKQYDQAKAIKEDSKKTVEEFNKKTAAERAAKAMADYNLYLRHGRTDLANEALNKYKQIEGIQTSENKPLISGAIKKFFPKLSGFSESLKKDAAKAKLKYGPRLTSTNIDGATKSLTGPMKQLVDLTKTNNSILSAIADKNPPIANWV